MEFIYCMQCRLKTIIYSKLLNSCHRVGLNFSTPEYDRVDGFNPDA